LQYFGERLKRVEDPPLLRGAARFVDDIPMPGALHAAFVRSPHPHAEIAAIDRAAARAINGVHAVYVLDDFTPHLTRRRLPLGFRDQRLPDDVTQCVLAADEVCYVGEAVAVVLADSRYAAEDAAALVDIDYRILGSVSDCRDAIAPGAPRVRGRDGDNILVEFVQHYGDADAAFARAPHVFRTRLSQHRGGAHPLEGRGAVARFDAADDRLTLWSSTQMSHEVRASLVVLLGLDESRLRVVAPEIGGGFGAKYLMYPEEVVVCLAALLTGRPVKWIEDRREHFIASIQERDQYWDVEIATDDDGMILAVRGAMIHDQGAYTPQGINLPYNASTAVPGPYIVPNYHLAVTVAETNRVPAMPVRGAGYPEGCFTMERLLDRAAIGLGIDRAEIRRRNLVPPERMPYESPLKTRAGTPVTCDSGDFPRCQELALDRLDYAGFPARRDAARRAGRHLGIGLSNGLKGTGRGPFESGAVRIERSGQVSVFTGALAMGQGLRTALAQICAEQLGVAIADINVVAGDTAAIALGQGGFASRQAVTAGSSVHVSAKEVRAKALKMAAHLLEAAEQDLELADGEIRIAGAPGLAISLREVAEAASGVPGYALPGDIEPGMEATNHFAPAALTYSNGVHGVELEVDIETGAVTILRYVAVSDSGRLINPMMVDGQIHGGVVHGIGNGLFERMIFDPRGQPLTTSFADYLLPTAPEIPNMEVVHHVSPSPLNPLGVKGVGECGTIPAAAAIVSAVEDALAPFGVCIEEAPITPMRIIELIAAAKTVAAQSAQSA
jgi:aerobic carbon-monoxide dehydrogenase large subunit